MSPISPISIDVADKPYTNRGSLPVHPRVMAYWIAYFAHRLTTVLDDESISMNILREWLSEMSEDLKQLALLDGQLDDTNHDRARHLADAMQAFIFHEGPDPDEDPALRALCDPDWSDIFPPAVS
ncbi:MAG: hypothetical protein C7B46_19315 [Sulfobacillus benefaciens]|uniref:Uncharacterized protein n=1 Tax=Sulfobacillus benefaciens TaxID=453960 RepID=A0A2T2WZD8_9FIRM|nr:MAG: hypothetical protein C7B46_19315 [Sulfobacillus benefaciens]